VSKGLVAIQSDSIGHFFLTPLYGAGIMLENPMKSIKTKIILLVLILTTLVVGSVLNLSSQSNKVITETIEQDMVNSSFAYADHVKRFLSAYARVVAVVTQAEELESRDADKIRRYFIEVMEGMGLIESVSLYDINGNLWVTTSPADKAYATISAVSSNFVGLFERAKSSVQGSVHFSEADVFNEHISTAVMSPITDDTNQIVQGVLSVNLNLDSLLAQNSQYKTNRLTALVNSRGIVVASSDQSLIEPLTHYPDYLANPLLQDVFGGNDDIISPGTFFSFDNQDGIEQRAIYHLVESDFDGANWVLITTQPETALFAIINRLVLKTYFLLGLFIVIAVITSNFLLKIMLSPIQTITTAMQNISDSKSGDGLKAEIDYRNFPSELMPLFNTFKSLMNSLLRNKEERDQREFLLKKIVESTAEGIVVADSSNDILYLSEHLVPVFDVPHGNYIGEPLTDVIKNVAVLRAVQMAGSGSHSTQEFSIANRDSRALETWIITMLELHYSNSDDSTAPGSIYVFENITGRAAANALKNKILMTTAHEFRTPLTVIRGYVSLLMHSQLDEKSQKGLLREIEVGALSLSNIVDDLSVLHDRNGGFSPIIEVVDCNLGAEMKKVFNEVQDMYPFRKFDLQAEDRELRIRVDKSMCTATIKHLLYNAIKFSDNQSVVAADMRVAGDAFLISVTDQGIGIAEDEIPRIFDQFYRSDTSDTAREGMGLGLAVAKVMADVHKGSIKVNSKLGIGTTVTLSLPVE
jgi:signal transduction histidine kinase